MLGRAHRTRGGEPPERSRRRFLQLAATGSTLLLAGCSGDDESSDDGESNDGTPADGATGENETTGEDTGDEVDEGRSDEEKSGDDSDGDEQTDREWEIPVTGTAVPELTGLDEAMVSYMTDLGIEGGVLGVARNGDVVLERGYGWADDAETTPTAPGALCRIASISKTLTKAAIDELEASGQLSGDDPALEYLDIDPPGGEVADDRLAEVTVQQLLDHRGGLAPSRVPGDPVFDPRQVADALGLTSPPESEDMVRYLLDQQLSYEPGTAQRYSNSGYVVLGHVVSGAAGESYQSYLAEAVLPAPGDIGLAQTDPADRGRREMAYHSSQTAPTALDLDSDEAVSLPDGGFLVEVLGGAGGLYSSTRALLEFMEEYWIYYGRPRSESVPVSNPVAIGSIPGSYAVALHQGPVDAVALFNRRRPDRSGEIIDQLRTAIDGVDEWPSRE